MGAGQRRGHAAAGRQVGLPIGRADRRQAVHGEAGRRGEDIGGDDAAEELHRAGIEIGRLHIGDDMPVGGIAQVLDHLKQGGDGAGLVGLEVEQRTVAGDGDGGAAQHERLHALDVRLDEAAARKLEAIDGHHRDEGAAAGIGGGIASGRVQRHAAEAVPGIGVHAGHLDGAGCLADRGIPAGEVVQFVQGGIGDEVAMDMRLRLEGMDGALRTDEAGHGDGESADIGAGIDGDVAGLEHLGEEGDLGLGVLAIGLQQPADVGVLAVQQHQPLAAVLQPVAAGGWDEAAGGGVVQHRRGDRLRTLTQDEVDSAFGDWAEGLVARQLGPKEVAHNLQPLDVDLAAEIRGRGRRHSPISATSLSALKAVKVHLWSVLARLGQCPRSYMSSSGMVMTRWPPGLVTRIQCERATRGSTMCSRQWLAWTRSKLASGTPARNCASPSGRSHSRTAVRRGKIPMWRARPSGPAPMSSASPAM